jgi:hypothetical protein
VLVAGGREVATFFALQLLYKLRMARRLLTTSVLAGVLQSTVMAML